MKKSDIAMIILIISASLIVAFFSAKAIFGDVYNESAKVKTVDAISSTVTELDTRVFNSDAVNPTVQVEINGTE